MSQYLFRCLECKNEFTRTLHVAELEKTDVTCPHCGSQKVQQLVAAFSAVTSHKS